MTDLEKWMWKWVERGFFSNRLSTEEAINIMACHPDAPWGKDNWDTSHLEYHDKVMKFAGKSDPEKTKPILINTEDTLR
jgi:hypothetical protein